ncbi:MAG: leucine--tRNA ligase [Candidatus Pacebacteria bacterium]|nr:leucine--tRNA ligase [Candidatus Paceibacterota bacterium]
MEAYNHQKIEKKWQEYWEESGFYKAVDSSKKPKQYILIEFPYPSGDGLHVGHCRSYSALDAVARKKRMEGFNVLYPIGWDAFGLPTENYAIKTGVHPKTATEKNIANFKRQLKSLGLSFDWSREINTTDPKYYKWTQWIFLQLFKKGLAYQAEIPINWCPSCKIGLAHEEVIGGKCERCGAQTEQKTIKQWLLKITKYADRLIEDLDKVDYLEKIKIQQINWIGKSYGTEVDFKIEKFDKTVTVFTTRVDTIFSGTYLILAPESKLVKEITTEEQKAEVERYIKETAKKNELERIELEKERNGAFTGAYAINPATDERIPIWIADFVLAHYGTGAVFADAHDQRDFEMAKKYNIPLKVSLRPEDDELWGKVKNLEVCCPEEGILVNSGKFDGLTSREAIKKITEWFEKRKVGRKAINYKLRDWVFSRQHYWGEPIPIIHCEKCGAVPVSEKELPIELPYVEKYQPTGTGESPLSKIEEWVNVKCPKCKGPAKRETDTMPNWAGSNWYYIRYTDPGNDKKIADKKKLKHWLPVDWYDGGFEHTTLHLLYSRFWYKFLYDIDVVPGPEPYKKRTSHGIVLAEDSRKMSKSFGNVINPDDIVKSFGADSLRLYEMFMGPFDQAINWNINGLKGCYRFLDKIWKLSFKVNQEKGINSQELEKLVHKTIKKINEDLEDFKFNTAVSALMILANRFEIEEKISLSYYSLFLVILAPFAPHITEELWGQLGNKDSIHKQSWPKYDKKLIKDDMITLVVQVNGRVRDKIEVEADISEEKAKELAISSQNVKKWVQNKEIKKVIFVPRRLINIVI